MTRFQKVAVAIHAYHLAAVQYLLNKPGDLPGKRYLLADLDSLHTLKEMNHIDTCTTTVYLRDLQKDARELAELFVRAL